MSSADSAVPDVSICIPVFNERGALRKTVVEIMDVLEEVDWSYELIIVDDGSTDDCLATVDDLDIRVVRHKRNFGGGVARMTALQASRGSIVVQTDADDTYPAESIPHCVDRIRSGVDMVVGARSEETATDRRRLRWLVKQTINRFASLVAGTTIPDLNSGFRVYRRDKALEYGFLYPPTHSIMSTMTLSMLRSGDAVEFHPIAYRERIGESSFHPVRDTYTYIVTIFRVTMFFEPLRLFIPAALALLVASVGFGISSLIRAQEVGVLAGVLFLTAFGTFALGLVSDQIAGVVKALRWGDRSANWMDTHVTVESRVGTDRGAGS